MYACIKKSNIKVALIAAILLNKRASDRNYILDDTASNKGINYVSLLPLILLGTFNFRVKQQYRFLLLRSD